MELLGAQQAGRLGRQERYLSVEGGRRRACSEEVLLSRTGSARKKEDRTVGCLQTRQTLTRRLEPERRSA
jgi:hypothetical protein